MIDKVPTVNELKILNLKAITTLKENATKKNIDNLILEYLGGVSEQVLKKKLKNGKNKNGSQNCDNTLDNYIRSARSSLSKEKKIKYNSLTKIWELI